MAQLMPDEKYAWAGSWAEREMVEGYIDGRDLSSPQPSANRSRSYRHGFECGRDDRSDQPRDTAENLRRLADEAIAEDNITVAGVAG